MSSDDSFSFKVQNDLLTTNKPMHQQDEEMQDGRTRLRKKNTLKWFFFLFLFFKENSSHRNIRIQIKQMYFIIGNKISPVLKWNDWQKLENGKNDFLIDLDSKWNQASKDNNTLLAQNPIP